MLYVAADPVFALHDTGRGHPERAGPAPGGRRTGSGGPALGDALLPLPTREATRAELERVHPAAYLDVARGGEPPGGGHLDADTPLSPDSWRAAVTAAGTGIAADRRARDGRGGRRVPRACARPATTPVPPRAWASA